MRMKQGQNIRILGVVRLESDEDNCECNKDGKGCDKGGSSSVTHCLLIVILVNLVRKYMA